MVQFPYWNLCRYRSGKMLCDWLEKSGKVREFCSGRPVWTLIKEWRWEWLILKMMLTCLFEKRWKLGRLNLQEADKVNWKVNSMDAKWCVLKRVTCDFQRGAGLWLRWRATVATGLNKRYICWVVVGTLYLMEMCLGLSITTDFISVSTCPCKIVWKLPSLTELML